ncbi:tape measure protein [Acinetobacter towneri]|uniref:Tape measure protein n=1 Tax=Acinetobacter towneri TaxID=202956 RepID=A0AB35LYF2_9GAMM|nr:tape measure protein [Acinetobacter towneri]MDM1718041.1 tape measure protein [Acinetobacter towneri]MDM1734716.1 tape measure protein [Acinetobacter towneri]MDM1738055.1 tape measure protein [Acinetobacter towneri]MDM1741827.1 tape measure protein [Acinetobacter towneri]MDM1745227.1 tape measure protein [Acinetobacter towneri]
MATKLGTLTLDLVAKIGNFTQGMRQASSSAEREMQRASSSVNVMNGMLGKLAATAGAVFSINQIKNYADSYTGIVNQLKLVTNGQAELNTAMNDTYKIAQATASSWGAVNDVYSKYMANAKVLNLTQAETARLTEVTSKAVSISGSTTEAAAGALFQFGQALDGNILRAEEYNSLVDGAGGLLNAMAKGLGVTRGELRQMMLDGKLSGQVITEALLKAGDSVDELYSKTDTTIAASFNLITTEVTKMVGEFDSATGASKTFVEGIALLSQNMDALVDVTMVAGAYWAGTYIPVLVKGTQATIADTAGKVSNALATRSKALADYDVAKSNLAATAAMVRSMGVTNAQTTAMMANARAAYQQAAAAKAAAVANTGVLGILGGPVGIGVTLATVAAGYLLMKDNTDKATASIDTQGKSVGELIEKYRELNTLQRDNETKALADQVEELSLKYRVASSDLLSFMESLPIADDKIATFRKLNSELSQGRISTDDYYKSIKEVNILTDDQLSKVRTLIGAYTSNKEKLNEAKVAQDALSSSMTGTTQKAKEQAIGVAQLSEAIKKLLKESNQTIKDSAITSALASRGYNDTMIELAKKYLNVEGAIVTNAKGQKVLKDELKAKLREEYQAIMRSKNAVDERNKAEEKSKKLLEATGNAMKVNAKVAANAAKYNFAAIEAKNKLPSGLLSAIHMQESKGNPNAYNKSSGAAGGFQFLEGTAKQYGVKDRYNLAQSAEGAGKYMAYLLDLFKGDLDKAVSAYHAGEGNVQRGTNIGPVNRQYVKNIKGYLGGSSGVSFTEDYSFDDWLKELEQHVAEQEKLEKELAETKKAIQVSYYSEWQNLEYDNQERIKEIEKAFATDPTERDRLLGLQQKAYEDDVANWIKAQDERVKAENEANQQIILARQNAFAAMNGPLGAMVQMGVEASAKASMNPLEYQKWRMGNEQQDGYSQLADNLYSVREGIQNNEYLTDTEKYAQLNEAYRTYLESKKALTQEYAQQEADFAQYQHENQLSLYGSLLSQAGTVWGEMTQMVRDAKGENSKTFKAMFLAQQSMAIAQQIINTELAAGATTAQTGIFGLPAAAVIRGIGYASVGLIAAQTIQGMAHDGIDNIPREGTWLLDKGERVVDSRTNADLKDYLAKGGGSGGDVNITVHVTDSGVSTQSNQNEQKQLGQMIGNAVRTIIRQEQRQGGLLSK